MDTDESIATMSRAPAQPAAPGAASWWTWWLLALCCVSFSVGAVNERARPAPAWTLDSTDGATIEFPRDAAGRPAVMLFWASWCPHCRSVLPYIESLRREFAPRGVKFYALNIWEDGDALAYFNKHDYRLTLILAADLVAEQYGIASTPGIVVTDGGSEVLDLGSMDAPPEQVASIIREVLERELERAGDSSANSD